MARGKWDSEIVGSGEAGKAGEVSETHSLLEYPTMYTLREIREVESGPFGWFTP
jgi:hypothetical protein